ncbi:cerebellin-2-like [Osmerus eperlanus]|uniref:cerebellin-2-like n=1 Tax=Osmerus eperlanus TaxID=29151 RepID=UPI002E101FCC
MVGSIVVLLALSGCLSLGTVQGQRGDLDIGTELDDIRAKLQGLKDLEARLNHTEKELEGQKAKVDRLEKENEEITHRLNATEDEVEKLRNSGSKKRPQVAFSASLSNFGEIYKGPCSDTTLIFKRVFSNIGNGYDQHTGFFKAPVEGLYYFTFSTFGYNTHLVGAVLMKGGVRVVSTYDHVSSDSSDGGSNAVVLELKADEKVSVELWQNARVFDNMNGHTTFSGFLLYPLGDRK